MSQAGVWIAGKHANSSVTVSVIPVTEKTVLLIPRYVLRVTKKRQYLLNPLANGRFTAGNAFKPDAAAIIKI